MEAFFQFFIIGLLEGALYALVGASIALVFKATEVASLAHGHILAFGALLFYFFFSWLHLPLFIALLLTFVANCILGLIIERVALRPLIGQSNFSAFLITFCMFLILDGCYSLILHGTTLNFPDFLPTGRFSMGSASVPIAQFVSFIACLAVFGLLGLFFRLTKMGLNMLATAENHLLAQSTGINVKKTFSFVWGLSALVATTAGMATANVMEITYLVPYIGIKGLIVALFGGLDSILGALIAGLMLGILENLAVGYIDPLVGGGTKEVAAYAMLLVILLIRPYGLFGQIRIERI